MYKPFTFADLALIGNRSIFKLIGGLTTSYNEGGFTYMSHTFLTSGELEVMGQGDIEFLIIGGGGATRDSIHTGGGGAGGFLLGTSSISSGNYSISVGAGGNKSPGSNSTFIGLTAFGGGGWNVLNGGSGAAAHTSITLRGLGVVGQGFAGGFGVNWDSGGGGGAGGTGSNGTAAQGGHGGIGRTSSYRNGTSIWYAGGGGGGVDTSTTFGGGLGGTGGGGTGGRNNVNPGNGETNTGGGGGGRGVGSSTNSTGGSGIVIIRYKI